MVSDHATSSSQIRHWNNNGNNIRNNSQVRVFHNILQKFPKVPKHQNTLDFNRNFRCFVLLCFFLFSCSFFSLFHSS